jgi:hypothetical protein
MNAHSNTVHYKMTRKKIHMKGRKINELWSTHKSILKNEGFFVCF